MDNQRDHVIIYSSERVARVELVRRIRGSVSEEGSAGLRAASTDVSSSCSSGFASKQR